MSKYFSLKNYPFSIKIIFSFFLLIVFSVYIRTLWIIPRIEDRNIQKEIDYISKILQHKKENIQLASKFLNTQNFFEVEKYLDKNILISKDLKSSRYAIFRINSNIDDNILKIKLCSGTLEEREKRCTLSKISNTKKIPTGNLTIKEIFELKDTGAKIHKIGQKELITWIIQLTKQKLKNPFLLVYTIDKKELELKHKSEFFTLFAESLVIVGLSLIALILLFGRIFSKINSITKTAILVNKGKTGIRSKVKGSDDIGILGESFDLMLDSIENNMKILDKKVEEKTDEISKSLEEKDVLLREIHHRVKNNLTLTISLIQLQELNVQDEDTKKALKDIQERIFTMVLIHQKLYESKNLNKISLKAYVSDLINAIVNSYSKNTNLKLIVQIDELELDIQSIMPLGIILNELITNAFKYAFSNKEENELKVIISNQKDKKINIIVKDNGEKEIEDFLHLSNKTLGLKLVNTIVKYQLFGNFSYKFENGSEFQILGSIQN